MPKRLIDIKDLDHPEHYDDVIREFQSQDRYNPGPLASHLYEVAGHRCTICQAPWLEIHHIQGLFNGGKTEYSNLIVLCPNCHTRVHSQNVPTPDELRHYKLKQEIAYGLPSFGRLLESDKGTLKYFAALNDGDLSVHELVSSFDTRMASRRTHAMNAEESVPFTFKNVELSLLLSLVLA